MSIVMRMRWAGLTPDQYDTVREIADWERDRPDGGLLHVAWFDDDGMQVRDVWRSTEQLDSFVNTRLMPAINKAGITSQPEVSVAACHATQCELVIGGRLLIEQSTVPADVYDTLASSVRWAAEAPIGAICHIAAEAPDGMLDVISVWRSAQASVNFGVDRIAVVASELGIDLGIDGNPPALCSAHAVYCPVPTEVTA